MTENQIENGFWLWDKKNGFPPDSITYPAQFRAQTKLNIACNISLLLYSDTEFRTDTKKKYQLTC